jgi:5-hydroxyisourate hydrolase
VTVAAVGLSVHVVDIAGGVPAAGMRVDLFVVRSSGTLENIFCDRRLDRDGKIAPAGETIAGMIPCRFELRFHVADYYHAARLGNDTVPFIDILPFRFGIENTDCHHHLPAKITPWGLSLFLTK